MTFEKTKRKKQVGVYKTKLLFKVIKYANNDNVLLTHDTLKHFTLCKYDKWHYHMSLSK